MDSSDASLGSIRWSCVKLHRCIISCCDLTLIQIPLTSHSLILLYFSLDTGDTFFIQFVYHMSDNVKIIMDENTDRE